MIDLPDFQKKFEYENGFYLSCDVSRISKLMAHYELFKRVNDLSGAIVECGILKGCSISRFATFRELLSTAYAKRIIGFDTFGRFPKTQFEADIPLRKDHIKMCGQESISRQQLSKVLEHKGVEKNIDLVEGDILKTLPEFLKKNPELRISLLNLDVDIYEPSKLILELLYPRIVKGGILILDDYGTFPGETQAADEYFDGKNVAIRKFSFCETPSYVIKQ